MNTLITLHLLINKAGDDFQTIGALLVDVITRVTSYETFDRTLDKEITLRDWLTLHLKLGSSGTTTSTRNENLTLILRVKVDEEVAVHKTGLHSFCTCQSCLFITCEYTLDGTMLNIIAVEDSQFHGDADTVVGTKRSSFCTQPFAIYISGDTFFVEVYRHVRQTIAYHVHVALQDDCLAILIARSGSFADDDITYFVDYCLQTTALTKGLQILNHLLLSL